MSYHPYRLLLGGNVVRNGNKMRLDGVPYVLRIGSDGSFLESKAGRCIEAGAWELVTWESQGRLRFGEVPGTHVRAPGKRRGAWPRQSERRR